MKSQKLNDQVTPDETSEILRLAEQCLPLAGDFVEFGCYRGDTSVLLGKLLAKFSSPALTQVSAQAAAQSSAQSSLSASRRSSVLSGNAPRACAACVKPVENSELSVDNLCKNPKNQCKTCVKSPDSCVQNVENSPESVQNSVENPVGKRLWIYDSFAGLPEKTTEDNSGAGRNFQKGELFVTKREVIDKIRRHGLHNVIIKKAWFDDLEDKDLPRKIAFAFLDGDLYSSIKTSLCLVIPRLTEQGIIIVHDYNNPELPGSARAVDEFLRSHPNYKLTIRHTLAIIKPSH